MPEFPTADNWYVDSVSGSDSNDGKSWGAAKQTITATVAQIATDYQGSWANSPGGFPDGIVINVSGGTDGKEYKETRHIVISDASGSYDPQPWALNGGGPGTNQSAFPTPEPGKPIILQGSNENGHNGPVMINSDDIPTGTPSNNQGYRSGIEAVVGMRMTAPGGMIRYINTINTKIGSSPDAGIDSIQLTAAAVGCIVEKCGVFNYFNHGILTSDGNNARDHIIRYNYVEPNRGTAGSSAIKCGSDDSIIHHNIVVDAGDLTAAAYHVGIQVDQTTGVKVLNNTIQGARGVSILVRGTSSGVDLYNNYMNAVWGHHILVDTGSSLNATDNNCFYHARYSLSDTQGLVAGAFAFSATPGPEGTSGTYMFNAANSPNTYRDLSTYVAASSIPGFPDPHDANSIQTRQIPRGWARQSVDDFGLWRPNPASPLVNAGNEGVLSANNITRDFLGVGWTQNPTIGALEP